VDEDGEGIVEKGVDGRDVDASFLAT